MNKQLAIRYLAEGVMMLRLGSPNTEEEGYWINDKTGWRIATYDFDPIDNIEHAFMVIDVMKKHNWTMWLFQGKHISNCELDNIKEGKHSEGTSNKITKAICIAAVKATATDEQIAEMGL